MSKRNWRFACVMLASVELRYLFRMGPPGKNNRKNYKVQTIFHDLKYSRSGNSGKEQ